MKISLANHLRERLFFTREKVVSSNQKTPVKANRAILSVAASKFLAAMAQRFQPLESSVNEFIANQENMKLLKAFLTVKGETRKPEELTLQELNGYLNEFILSVKRKDGEDYEPSSLRGLIARVLDYLLDYSAAQ